MQKILEKLSCVEDWENKMKSECKLNGLKLSVLNSLTIGKVKSIYAALEKKYKDKQREAEDEGKQEWLQREKVIYPFLLIAICVLHKMPILSFGHEEYQLILQILCGKRRAFLQYETMVILNGQAVRKRKWEAEEQDMLVRLIEQEQTSNHNKVRWKLISQLLFEASNFHYFRVGKACRQRWYNHLDPHKKHGEWQEWEDRLIIEHVLNQGRKWSNIGKLLNNQRTEHMIKNRFNSMLIKHQKKYSEVMCREKLTEGMGEIFGVKAVEDKKDKGATQRKRRIKKTVSMKDYSSSLEQDSSPDEISSQPVPTDKILYQHAVPREEKPSGDSVLPSPAFCFYQSVPTPTTTYQSLTPLYSPTIPLYFGNFRQNCTNFQYFLMNQNQQLHTSQPSSSLHNLNNQVNFSFQQEKDS